MSAVAAEPLEARDVVLVKPGVGVEGEAFDESTPAARPAGGRREFAAWHLDAFELACRLGSGGADQDQGTVRRPERVSLRGIATRPSGSRPVRREDEHARNAAAGTSSRYGFLASKLSVDEQGNVLYPRLAGVQAVPDFCTALTDSVAVSWLFAVTVPLATVMVSVSTQSKF